MGKVVGILKQSQAKLNAAKAFLAHIPPVYGEACN